MSLYRMSTAPADIEDGDELIYATNPAHPGSYVVSVSKDGSINRTPVLCWGVLSAGDVVPLTLGGVWDGASDSSNQCVLHPDGSCSTYNSNWPTLVEAVEDLKKHGL
jgi:hypothetical protein